METLVLVSFAGLSVGAIAIKRLGANSDDKDGQVEDSEQKKQLKKLQYKFFGAYFLALFGDWLQGPYVYQLYHSYGFSESEIALLFLTGFGSSSTFGTFTGPLADKYGRKKMALLFAVVYGICCAIKISTNFWVLILGRLMGGVSTSLLFSVFESWYVKEHVSVHKLDSELLATTFATSTTANGIISIIAGVVANLGAETFGMGPIAPFIIAIPCFVLCFLVVFFTWDENFGDQDTHLIQSYKEGLQMILRDRKKLFLGLVQSIVESCMYIFVFLWTPVLSEGSKSAPLGLIFSSFMVAIVIGSSTFSILLSKYAKEPKDTLFYATVVFAGCTFICSMVAGPGTGIILKSICFLTFLVLEGSIGLYFPSIGCLRSQVIPESHRATITNWYRVPMNLITCVTLLTVNHPTVSADKRAIFAACTGMLITGALIANKFRGVVTTKKDP